MIEIRNLTKKYGSKKALDDVSLNIGPGEIIGLFGENGAGKTTMMKCIFNFIKYQGTILLDGEPIRRNNISRLAFATGEHSFFAELNAGAHADFYREHFPSFNEKRFEALMEFFRLPYDKKIREMSFGQQNQFEVIMALSQGADYIFMDEPFAGNDIFNRDDFYRVLAGMITEKETVILATHLIEEVSGFVGRAVLIKEGKIIGDKDTAELEEEGLTLVDYIRKSYHYDPDRAARLLSRIGGDET